MQTFAQTVKQTFMHIFAQKRFAVGAGIVGFWTIVALVNTSQSLLQLYLRSQSLVGWQTSVIWSSGFFVWAAATPVVMRLARQFPVSSVPSVAQPIMQHVGLAVVVVVCVSCCEVVLLEALYILVLGQAAPVRTVSGVFLYKFLLYLVLYGAIIGVTTGIEYFRKYQHSALEQSRLALAASELQAQLTQARLQLLRMQLQPHFLFNTHHAIVGLMLKQENEAAIAMLTKLSDLLRLTLSIAAEPMVALSEELRMAELYIGIQRIRFHNRLTVRCTIAPATQSVRIPTLLLQPLVENAFRHGLEPYSGDGCLEITTWLEATELEQSLEQSQADTTPPREWLHITIEDNGCGFQAAGSIDGAKNKGIMIQEGVGITNTKDRLWNMYGTAATFTIAPRAAGGTRVMIVVPALRDDEHSDSKPNSDNNSINNSDK